MINIKTSEPGSVTISDDAVAIIAGTAALEVDGVANLIGNTADGVNKKLGRKNLSKSVLISTENETVRISVNIVLKHDAKAHEVAKEAQGKIKTAVETMTGLEVPEVNITVCAFAEKQRGA